MESRLEEVRVKGKKRKKLEGQGGYSVTRSIKCFPDWNTFAFGMTKPLCGKCLFTSVTLRNWIDSRGISQIAWSISKKLNVMPYVTYKKCNTFVV